MSDAAEMLRIDYRPETRATRLRREAFEAVHERTPRVRIHRTHDGALVREVEVYPYELPEFLWINRR